MKSLDVSRKRDIYPTLQKKMVAFDTLDRIANRIKKYLKL